VKPETFFSERGIFASRGHYGVRVNAHSGNFVKIHRHIVFLVLTIVMPPSEPDIRHQMQEPSIEQYWADAAEFVQHGVPEVVTNGQAVMAGCLVRERRLTTVSEDVVLRLAVTAMLFAGLPPHRGSRRRPSATATASGTPRWFLWPTGTASGCRSWSISAGSRSTSERPRCTSVGSRRALPERIRFFGRLVSSAAEMPRLAVKALRTPQCLGI
jgi:hypothetical protein